MQAHMTRELWRFQQRRVTAHMHTCRISFRCFPSSSWSRVSGLPLYAIPPNALAEKASKFLNDMLSRNTPVQPFRETQASAYRKR